MGCETSCGEVGEMGCCKVGTVGFHQCSGKFL